MTSTSKVWRIVYVYEQKRLIEFWLSLPTLGFRCNLVSSIKQSLQWNRRPLHVHSLHYYYIHADECKGHYLVKKKSKSHVLLIHLKKWFKENIGDLKDRPSQMELCNCKFSWFWNIIWTIYEILFVMLEILQTAKRLAACQRRLKLRIRALSDIGQKVEQLRAEDRRSK